MTESERGWLVVICAVILINVMFGDLNTRREISQGRREILKALESCR